MKREETFAECLDQIQTALADQAGDIGVRYEGIATHLIDIRNFYVVPLSRYKLLHFIEKPGTISPDYDVGDVVIYFSPQLNRHIRGKVNVVNPDRSIDIYAMDYGLNEGGVTPDKIFYPLHREVEVVQGFAQLYELSMCYPMEGPEFTSEAQESFKFYMGPTGQPLRVTVMEKNDQKSSVLVMSNNSNPDDVSTALAYTNHTRLYAAPL